MRMAALLLLAGCAAPAETAPRPRPYPRRPIPTRACIACAEKEARNADLLKKVRRYEDIIAWLADRNVKPPRPDRNGVITVSERARVVVSVGRDHGAWVGDVLYVHRDSEVVAKIELETIDRLWSVGKVVVQWKEPRIDDAVTSDPSDLDLSPERH